MKKVHAILTLACLSTIGCKEAMASTSTLSLTFPPDSESSLRCPNPTFNGKPITGEQLLTWTKNPSINVTSLNRVKWPKFSEYQGYVKNYCGIVRNLYPNPTPGNPISSESLFWRPTLVVPKGIADPFSSLGAAGPSVPSSYFYPPTALFAIASSPAYSAWKSVAANYQKWSDFGTSPTGAADMANLATLLNLALGGAIGATSLNKNDKLVKTPFTSPVITAPDITLKFSYSPTSGISSNSYVQYLINDSSSYGMKAYQKLCPSVSQPSSVKGTDYVTGPDYDNDLFARANMSGCITGIKLPAPQGIIKTSYKQSTFYLLADASHLNSANRNCTFLTQPHLFAQTANFRTVNPVFDGVYKLMNRLFSPQLFPSIDNSPTAPKAAVASIKVVAPVATTIASSGSEIVTGYNNYFLNTFWSAFSSLRDYFCQRWYGV